MSMDAETFRLIVWDEMLYADMRANYFAELVRHYQLIDRSIGVCVLLASSGAVVVALGTAAAELKIGFPVLATAGSLWLVFSNYGIMARDASDLHIGWNSVKMEYENLWNTLFDPDAESRYLRIYDRAEIFSKAGTKFPNKERRLSYWLEQATKVAQRRYA